MPSAIIQKPTTSPPSPESPCAKKPRIKSPKHTTRHPMQFFHINIEDDYPLHEKYDLQDVYPTTYKAVVKATRQPRDEEEINIDLPAYFVYHSENKHWIFIKGPTSKYSRLVISNSLISNNRLSRSENLVPVLTQSSTNRQQNVVEKRRNCSLGAISPLFHNIFNISLT